MCHITAVAQIHLALYITAQSSVDVCAPISYVRVLWGAWHCGQDSGAPLQVGREAQGNGARAHGLQAKAGAPFLSFFLSLHKALRHKH
jgi:hypothetical protein